MDLFSIAFYVVSVVAVAASILVVVNRNPLVSALFLALSFIAVSGLFLLLHAHFLALIQILIYAGAIIVLFIYVVMFLDMSAKDFKGTYGMLSMLLGASLLVCLLFVFAFGIFDLTGEPFNAMNASYPDIISLANVLFTKYVVPFELVSIILIVGIIGAVLLVKNIEKRKSS